MIDTFVDSTTLIIIGACVAVGLLASLSVLGLAALVSAGVAAGRRLVGHRDAQTRGGSDSASRAATGAHAGTQSLAHPTGEGADP